MGSKVDPVEGNGNPVDKISRDEPARGVIGVTAPWHGETSQSLPSGFLDDPGKAVFGPELDRVSRRHARRYAPRVLEPEIMDEDEEAEAYMDATARAHLARLDAGWIEMILAAFPRRTARVLDVGTGGGQIPLVLARRRPGWTIWGVDRAEAMLRQGLDGLDQSRAAARSRVRRFIFGLTLADGRALPAEDNSVDLVISNSLLHHLADPTPVLDEIARVVRPGGQVLIRDLRRPRRLGMKWLIAWYGRHYSGTMRRLLEDSFAAAFTPEEMTIIVRHSRLAGARVFPRGSYLIVAT